jgi:hypothetical protein
MKPARPRPLRYDVHLNDAHRALTMHNDGPDELAHHAQGADSGPMAIKAEFTASLEAVAEV